MAVESSLESRPQSQSQNYSAGRIEYKDSGRKARIVAHTNESGPMGSRDVRVKDNCLTAVTGTPRNSPALPKNSVLLSQGTEVTSMQDGSKGHAFRPNLQSSDRR
jgi:hypothetical protein